MGEGPERTEVQQPAWELLRDHLGYEYADGRSPAFAAERESETEVLPGWLELSSLLLQPQIPCFSHDGKDYQ